MLARMSPPGSLMSQLVRMARPLPVGDEEKARVAFNLRVSIAAALVGATLGALANVLSGKPRNAVPLALLCVVAVLAYWLQERRRTGAAAVLFLLALVVSVQELLRLGYGIHDRAALLYPVIILVAALFLDRRLLVATTGLAILSALRVVRLEQTGALVTPFSAGIGWLPLVDMTIILVVSAVAAHLLVSDAVGGIAEARVERERLAAANRELEARSAELERFTYVVSHDLKSPLVTIRGFLAYVEKDARSGQVERLESDVARIRGATDRMAQLLEDLLELSRTGRIDRPPEDVPFEEVVREARALAEGRLLARGVRVEVDPSLPVVRGDRRRLVELVQNLLENAAKFMGERKDPEVRVGARPGTAGGDEAALFVADNGIGIDPAPHSRVFELFHRLDPRVEGTGPGLALARRIVETHGGKIWVESRGEGHGSTFCFSLPLARGEG
jgi:signal transduction histidine kinase